MEKRKGLAAATAHNEAEESSSKSIFGAKAMPKNAFEAKHTAEEKRQPVSAPKEEPMQARAAVTHAVLSEEAITSVLAVYEMLMQRDSKVQSYISKFVQSENVAQTVYNAITTPTHHAKALTSILDMYNQDSADRAFSLVSMGNTEVAEVRNQLGRIVLLESEVLQSEQVTTANKIEFCRAIEKTISNMTSEQYAIANEIITFLGEVNEKYKL